VFSNDREGWDVDLARALGRPRPSSAGYGEGIALANVASSSSGERRNVDFALRGTDAIEGHAGHEPILPIQRNSPICDMGFVPPDSRRARAARTRLINRSARRHRYRLHEVLRHVLANLVARRRRMDVTECSRPGSVRLDARELDHLAPLFGLRGDKRHEISSRAGHRSAP
jgi:hypothetical protein